MAGDAWTGLDCASYEVPAQETFENGLPQSVHSSINLFVASLTPVQLDRLNRLFDETGGLKHKFSVKGAVYNELEQSARIAKALRGVK